MRLSTKGRYSARFMLELAVRYGEGPAILKDISAEVDVSEKYLGQLVLVLKSAGLIQSVRGSHGGYMLTREPHAIKLLEVIEVVEGQMALVECVDMPDTCDKACLCVTHDIWKTIGEKIISVLDSITLEDMVQWKKEKVTKQNRVMYYI